MDAVLKKTSRLLFGAAPGEEAPARRPAGGRAAAASGGGGAQQGLLARRGLSLVVSAYEVAGPAAFDLLSNRTKLRIREDQSGQVFVDAAGAAVADGAGLAALMQAVARARKTAPTARNPGSSRWVFGCCGGAAFDA
jgi:hypothetical protein